MLATESFSCPIKSLTWERVRSVAGSSTAPIGCLAAERLSTLAGVTLQVGSLDIDSMTRAVGASGGFALSCAIN